MKKIVVAGLIAIGVIGMSQQQASAWVNSRFSVGLNWESQTGGNQLLWGAWRNGQPPGPEAFGGGFTPSYSAQAPQMMPQPMAQAAPANNYAPMPQNYPAQASYYYQPAAPAAQYASPYQFANYPRPIYYYPDASFYYYGR